jgi:hypothetical protein
MVFHVGLGRFVERDEVREIMTLSDLIGFMESIHYREPTRLFPIRSMPPRIRGNRLDRAAPREAKKEHH